MNIFGRALLLLVAVWVAGFVTFLSLIPSAPNADTSPTDAIVVLTGGSGRIEEGLSLLARGAGRRLFISGVGKGVRVPELLRGQPPFAIKTAPGEDPIVLGYEATDTRGNARETAQWAERENIRSLRIVTANYHMPRALNEFAAALPNVRLVPAPVFPNDPRSGGWWRGQASTKFILTEYHKFLASLAQRYLFAPLQRHLP